MLPNKKTLIEKLSLSSNFESSSKKVGLHKKPYLLTVRKMTEVEDQKRSIDKEIENYFSSPEKYFVDSPIAVGKKVKIIDINDPKLRSTKRKKTEKRMDSMSKSSSRNLYKSNNDSGKSCLLMRYLNKDGKQNNLDDRSKCELINNDRLKSIFESYKLKVNSNSNSDIFRNNIDNQLPKNIGQSLFRQNQKLNRLKNADEQNKRLSRYISKKINKQENRLLLNRIDSFRYKKEIIKEIENSKPLDERYGVFRWNISLRRPDHFQGVRNSYVNLKGNDNPFWGLVIEKIPRLKETTVRPGCEINNDMSEISKFKNYSADKFEHHKTVENLDSVSIKGKNLYNIEYKREMTSKKDKILYKVFIENGKTISYADINSIYGDETFYKNYNSSNKNKRKYIKKFLKE